MGLRQVIPALITLFIWTTGVAQDTSSTDKESKDTVSGAGMLGPSKLSEDPSLGVKAGLNYHTAYGSDVGEVSPRSGGHFGIFLEYPFSKILAGKVEVLYSREGYRYRDAQDSLNYMNLDFISLPIIVRYHLGKGLFVEGGPTANFLVGATNSTKEVPKRGSVTLSNGFRRFKGSNDTDVGDLFNSFELSVELGFGYVIKKGYEIGIRGDLGLTSVHGSSSQNSLGGRLSLAKTF
ncbi:MAG: porin family protein [Flavobacteriales bacterium]